MQTKQKCNLVWFRNNLRIHDNETLLLASKEDVPFVAVFCWETTWQEITPFGFKKMGDFRAKFLWESLQNLKDNLSKLNIPFFIKFGSSTSVFTDIETHFEVEKVFYQKEENTEEIAQEHQAKKALISCKVWKSVCNQCLYSAMDIDALFQGKIPDLFTHFRKKVEKFLEIRSRFPSVEIQDFHLEINSTTDEHLIEKLGFLDVEQDQRSAFPFNGGETAGLARLKQYLFDTHHIKTYKQTRNGLIGQDYSSKLSPWLANGSLSVVEIYHQLKKYEAQFGENESTYWLFFELLWRDYFKWISREYGNKIFQKSGLYGLEIETKENKNCINNWMSGDTDCDFVNANQKELKLSGWMSNRGRQNVASYFCKTLHQDWQIGAAFFESYLIDYDADSNYGNWLYLAGLGNDARDRKFNTQLQASNYDGQRAFRNLWNNE